MKSIQAKKDASDSFKMMISGENEVKFGNFFIETQKILNNQSASAAQDVYNRFVADKGKTSPFT
jgi:hypothetical protein